jgi:hypothetical protein
MGDQRNTTRAILDAPVRPRLEPLASRLERAERGRLCADMTHGMLAELVERDPCWRVWQEVWAAGMLIPFVAVGPPGVFLIWSFDVRWTPRQAAMVMPARRRIQEELGAAWAGQVEVVFHAPRVDDYCDRAVLVDDDRDEPLDLVLVGGRLDQVLECWEPVGGVYLDETWLSWLGQAGTSRWWRSEDEARTPRRSLDDTA